MYSSCYSCFAILIPLYHTYITLCNHPWKHDLLEKTERARLITSEKTKLRGDLSTVSKYLKDNYREDRDGFFYVVLGDRTRAMYSSCSKRNLGWKLGGTF